MIDFSDYRNEDGEIDWAAYHKAEIDNGERCITCGTHMFSIWEENNYPHKCIQCKELKEPSKVTHDKLIRCPKCKEKWEPADTEDYEVFQDGEHDICCQHCDHEFTISTMVQYNFTSPELCKEEEHEEVAHQTNATG